MCEMLLNEQLNGVELYFSSKPATDVLQRLKDCKFRWNGLKKCWYAKQNEKTLKLANEFSNNKTDNILIEKSNKQTIKENYYPDYDMVGGIKIYKTSEDVEILNFQSGYFADINCLVHFYCDSCCITDLTNALSTGKVCTTYNLNHLDWKRESIALPLYNDNNIKTIKDLYNFIISEKEPINFKIQKSEKKSIKTFSPFVKIKPIKTPNKWTIAHVWKAILSGQIWDCEQDYHYTDDYAYDNACDYNTGVKKDLPSFAKGLIESHSDGLYVSDLKDGKYISVHNYLFDCHTLTYDENCNLKKAKELRQKQKDELNNYNNILLSQVLKIGKSDLKENSLYNIKYLKMNPNTNKYEINSKLIHNTSIFYEDELRYKIIEIDLFIPQNRKIYTIANFYNRKSSSEVFADKRIINCGNFEYICTGYALKELLNEGYYFEYVSEKNQTINDIKEELQKRNSGKIITLFMKDETNYADSIYRLNIEELRIEDDDVCQII